MDFTQILGTHVYQGFGIVIDKFQFFTDLSAHHILFQDNKLSKYQLIFTKLGMCIDIVEIWFGIAIEWRADNFIHF